MRAVPGLGSYFTAGDLVVLHPCNSPNLAAALNPDRSHTAREAHEQGPGVGVSGLSMTLQGLHPVLTADAYEARLDQLRIGGAVVHSTQQVLDGRGVHWCATDSLPPFYKYMCERCFYSERAAAKAISLTRVHEDG